MTNAVICGLTNLFRVYLISRFIKVFLGDEDDANGEFGRDDNRCLIRALAYVCFFLVNTAAYLIFHMALVNFLCNMVGIVLIVSTYTKSVKINLFVTGSVYLIHMGCDTISTFLFVNYRDGDGFNQFFEVITVFLILICELLTERIVGTGHHKENVRDLSLSLVPLCSIGMFCAMVYTGSVTEKGIIIASVGLILINFFVYYLYHILSNMFLMEFENRMLRQRVQDYAGRMDALLQDEEKVKALRHDMKHHLNELKILAARKENSAIEEYIDDMGAFLANPDETVSSGNAEIDSLLNYMLRRARQELAVVNADVRLPGEVGHAFDINVILGNLLENAIDAAAQTEEKRLDFRMELAQGFLRLQIENSYDGKVKQDGGRLLTTKADQGPHGIGLENVRKIVGKYDGKMEIHPGGDRFCVLLILYMPEMKDGRGHV